MNRIINKGFYFSEHWSEIVILYISILLHYIYYVITKTVKLKKTLNMHLNCRKNAIKYTL